MSLRGPKRFLVTMKYIHCGSTAMLYHHAGTVIGYRLLVVCCNLVLLVLYIRSSTIKLLYIHFAHRQTPLIQIILKLTWVRKIITTIEGL